MNDIQVFSFDQKEVRVVIINGEPWWVARDVCDVLGLSWDGHRLDHVPVEWKGSVFVTTPGGEQALRALSEQGLYFFLARSDKPAALPFQKWIAGEVILSIRKTGSYSTIKGETGGFSIPKTYAEALRLAADQAEQIERMIPKVESAEALTCCDKNMSITNASKHFNLHPKTQVFPFLRDKGFLTSRDLPTQIALDNDILAIRQNKCDDETMRPQAVVETRQLEKWRTWLVPRIVEWSNVIGITNG